MLFHFYRVISRFYGMNYDEDDDYIFNSKDVKSDIKRLFYMNHEDTFTADQYNKNKKTVDKLLINEMEKETHSTLRIELFRTFFENIP